VYFLSNLLLHCPEDGDSRVTQCNLSPLGSLWSQCAKSIALLPIFPLPPVLLQGTHFPRTIFTQLVVTELKPLQLSDVCAELRNVMVRVQVSYWEAWNCGLCWQAAALFSSRLTSEYFSIAVSLDFVHHPVFSKLQNTTFRKLDMFPSSGWGRRHLLCWFF
jgi:hypothetical protein